MPAGDDYELDVETEIDWADEIVEILPEPEEDDDYLCRSCGRSPCAAWCEGS